MGWSSFRLDTTVKQWFTDTFNSEKKLTLLDVAIVRRNELYAAVRINEGDEAGNVICFTYSLSYHPKAWNNFSYKDMTEFSGPCMDSCPERILKLLTPLKTDDEYNKYAVAFRERCWQKINNRKRIKGNCLIETVEPIKFSNGISAFNFIKKGKTMEAIYRDSKGIISGGFRVKIDICNHGIKEVTKI